MRNLMTSTRVSAIVFITFCLTTVLHGAEAPEKHWPRWRGPGADGSAVDGSYHAEFSNTTNVKWKVELPGKGCSTPAVWGDRIILTTPLGDDDGVLCLDWSGKEMWRATVGDKRDGRHRNGSSSNPSPVTDGKQIFAYFKSGNLAAMSMDGKVAWTTNLQKRWSKDTLYWDLGTSPVLTDKHVVVAVMHKGESYVAAFEKASGELAWRTLRNYKCPVEGDHSYATPTVVKRDGKEVVLVWGAEHVTAHDAADGKLLWECGGFNPNKRPNWVAVASPVLVGDVYVVPYGRGKMLAGVKLGGSGDVTATHRAWEREDLSGFVPTPAARGGKVYVVRDRGEVVCIDAATGETAWEAKLPRGKGKFYSSPVIADGKLYVARETGEVYVAQLPGEGEGGDAFKLIAENDMNERVIATPVPVADRLLIRGEQHLFAIE